MNKPKKKYTLEELKEAVANSLSIAGVLKSLGLIVAGGNYKTIKEKIAKHKLDTSHFTGMGWRKGKKIPGEKIPLSKILVNGSTYRTSLIRPRLIKEGYKEHKCEICGNTTWQGKEIPLELHHINGINTDNRIENLQLLCPNCHALTDTFRGKNIKKSGPSLTN